jgi:hypothetical protein
MRVRLTRRLANYIDGVDLSRRSVGDVLDLPEHDAEMLVAEGWALALEREPQKRDRIRANAANVSSRRNQRRRF